MFLDVQKVTGQPLLSKYALAKVRYGSAERALNFLYHQDDSGKYEHTYIGISSKEDFKLAEDMIDTPSLPTRKQRLVAGRKTSQNELRDLFVASDIKLSTRQVCFICGDTQANHRNKDALTDEFKWDDSPIVSQFPGDQVRRLDAMQGSEVNKLPPEMTVIKEEPL